MTDPGGVRRWRLVRADRDAVPPSVRRFMRRARQRRIRAALPWAVGVAVVAVAAGIGWMIYGTSVLGVRRVEVSGAVLLDPPRVRDAAQVADLTPLARVDIGAVAARVEALPAVDRAVVSRRWPGTLLIEVVERTGAAAVPQGDAFAVVDDEGVAFRTLPERPGDLPLLVVAKPGPDDVNTRAGLEVLAALSPELRAKLISVTVEAPARIRLNLDGERTIVWGDSSQSPVKSSVATALLDRKEKTIDVSAPEVVSLR
ncbi:cell division protein FtsQ/DivIB [Catenuloplanes atrovinosus]|uniref:Cell division protein FtsQ n=1 Tax=Catenuloplanes atrovinosus TaxID=137266 RepID=A0AAE4CCN0_9ACTN|nr:FtsQ-type POTRA domain-containing protein [Catenuloplanes atrovinosus]MDR7278159.1 cell division protein FtsQ [Catenuloplanes atrovinosus]